MSLRARDTRKEGLPENDTPLRIYQLDAEDEDRERELVRRLKLLNAQLHPPGEAVHSAFATCAVTCGAGGTKEGSEIASGLLRRAPG